jgi:hypothetical protein
MTTEATPGALGSNDQLGPLPEPATPYLAGPDDYPEFTADQMRAYAAQEVAADRQRTFQHRKTMSTNTNAIALLQQAFDALEATADSDIDDFEDEEEEAQAVPAQYACRKIMEAMQMLKGAVEKREER